MNMNCIDGDAIEKSAVRSKSYLNNTSKLKYLKIEKDLTASVLYDRNFSDIFILAIKKEINITSLDCF